MRYSELVALFEEENRPSGGLDSVMFAAGSCRLGRREHILEIGCNTGFTAINLHLLARCRAVGVDINAASVDLANARARRERVSDHVSFVRADATELDFASGRFDLVWLSNVPSFVADKASLVRESSRVLALHGYLVHIPIYYHRSPPQELLQRVSRHVGIPVKERTATEASNELEELLAAGDGAFQMIANRRGRYRDARADVDDYVKRQVDGSANGASYAADYGSMMSDFAENLLYCEYDVRIYQKRVRASDEELFDTFRVDD